MWEKHDKCTVENLTYLLYYSLKAVQLYYIYAQIKRSGELGQLHSEILRLIYILRWHVVHVVKVDTVSV